jgi:hypothetical protein
MYFESIIKLSRYHHQNIFKYHDGPESFSKKLNFIFALNKKCCMVDVYENHEELDVRFICFGNIIPREMGPWAGINTARPQTDRHY